MSKIKGMDVLVSVDTDGGGSPVDIAVQRGATLSAQADGIDFTDKSADGWSDQAAGMKSWNVDVEAIWDDSDPEIHTVLWTAFDAGTNVEVKLTDGTTSATSNVFSGDMQITNFSIEAPHDGECSVSITMVGRGELTKAKLA